jgi:hypothetical protein
MPPLNYCAKFSFFSDRPKQAYLQSHPLLFQPCRKGLQRPKPELSLNLQGTRHRRNYRSLLERLCCKNEEYRKKSSVSAFDSDRALRGRVVGTARDKNSPPLAGGDQREGDEKGDNAPSPQSSPIKGEGELDRVSIYSWVGIIRRESVENRESSLFLYGARNRAPGQKFHTMFSHR